MVVVEVCVESAAGVRAARAAGAQRVELCCALSEGGLTPSAALREAALAVGGIEVIVLVRPREGDFVYADEEFALLAREVELARAAGAGGVAVGCLTAEGDVDAARVERLVALARPLPVTFHRAFDHARDPERALSRLSELGVARVLTAGQAASAREGVARIGALVRASRGRIQVVAAGGVRPENVRAIVAASGVEAVHFSASVPRAGAMRHPHPSIRLRAARAEDEGAYSVTDEGRVRALLAALAG